MEKSLTQNSPDNIRLSKKVFAENVVGVPTEARSWALGAIFTAAGLVLPRLVHLLPHGGPILLPIYFFTLVAGYKFGSVVGLISALGAPLAGFLIFGMPGFEALGGIVFKGVVLALTAGFAARRTGRVSLLVIACVVMSYLVIGGIFEWLQTGNIDAALQDLTLGVPGIFLQIFGGWAILKALAKI